MTFNSVCTADSSANPSWICFSVSGCHLPVLEIFPLLQQPLPDEIDHTSLHFSLSFSTFIQMERMFCLLPNTKKLGFRTKVISGKFQTFREV